MRDAISPSQYLSITLCYLASGNNLEDKIHKCYISPIIRHNCYGNLYGFNTQPKGLHKGKKKIVLIQNHYFISFFMYSFAFIYLKFETTEKQ
jgi:hypothetical protein